MFKKSARAKAATAAIAAPSAPPPCKIHTARMRLLTIRQGETAFYNSSYERGETSSSPGFGEMFYLNGISRTDLLVLICTIAVRLFARWLRIDGWVL